MAKRDVWFAIRLTVAEKLELRAMANLLGVTMTQAVTMGIGELRMRWMREQGRGKRAVGA